MCLGLSMAVTVRRGLRPAYAVTHLEKVMDGRSLGEAIGEAIFGLCVVVALVSGAVVALLFGILIWTGVL